MDQNLTKIIEEQFSTIPEQLQKMIASKNWQTKAQEIGVQYNLTEIERESLSEQILLVLLAFESRGDFLANLKKVIHIGEDKLSLIAQKIDNDVFIPVGDILDALDEVEEAPGGVEMATENTAVTTDDTSIENRDDILHGIEEPESILPEIAPQNLPTTTNESDSLVSGAMSKPTITPKENTPSQKISTYRASDPYREPFE